MSVPSALPAAAAASAPPAGGLEVVLDELRPDAAGSYARLITYVKDRPGHDRRYAIDPTKIQRDIGWQPAETFSSGIRKTVQWFLDNGEWIDTVRSGAYRDWIAQNYSERT